MKTPLFTFARLVRDCPHNDAEPTRLIYDFEVMADGERVAVWHRNAASKGYSLHSLEGLPVRDPARDYRAKHYGADAETQTQFAARCAELFEQGAPLNRERAEARRVEYERMRACFILNKKTASNASHVQAIAAELYAMLKDCGEAMPDSPLASRVRQFIAAQESAMLDKRVAIDGAFCEASSVENWEYEQWARSNA